MYPAKWYIREENDGAPSLFITQEPIRNAGDKYKVGLGAFYKQDYFIHKEPSNSEIGKMGKSVLAVVNWEEDKQRFLENLKNNGNTILSQSEIKIFDQPAIKIECKSKIARMAILYIKLGKDLLMLFFETPPDEYAQYKETFEQMIKSLSIRSDFKIINEATIFTGAVQQTIINNK
jgi:hypothetical protein